MRTLAIVASLLLLGCKDKAPESGNSATIRLEHGRNIDGYKLVKGCQQLLLSGVEGHRIFIESMESGLTVPFSTCKGTMDDSHLATLWSEPDFLGQVVLVGRHGTTTLFSGSDLHAVWIIADVDCRASDLIDFAHSQRDALYYFADVDHLRAMLPSIQVDIRQP